MHVEPTRMRVWAPLPDHDFDVTEIAVPWKLLTQAGHQVVFATETGQVSACDPRLLTGVLFGQLGADPEPKAFYGEMQQVPEFQHPLRWGELDPAAYDGLLLTGGHDKGMRQYLESRSLQEKVAAFWALDRPVGAICHGTIVLARTVDPRTGKSVLFKKKTTCLCHYMERTAWLITAWKLGGYYRTYPEYVQDEVWRSLENPHQQFVRGPVELLRRGTASDDGPAFVVVDGNYVSARWPGDAYLYGRTFLRLLNGVESPGRP